MPGSWLIRIYEKQQLVSTFEEQAEPLELGRQSQGEDGPFNSRREAGRCRIVVARLDEDTVSRQHALLEPLDPDKARLTNLSKKLPIRLADGSDLRPGGTCELALPATVTLGRKTIRLQPTEVGSERLESLLEATMPPGREAPGSTLFPNLAAAPAGVETEKLIRWLQAAAGVLHSAATSADFFTKAARAVVDLVGLDTGRVLLLEDQTWKVTAVQTAPGIPPEDDWQPSRQVLGRMQQEKRTFWMVPGQSAQYAASLVGVKAVVAAPVLDRQGAVIGALYGDRRRGAQPADSSRINRAEAMLVEVLAGGIAAGLARLEQERAALEARVRFEQFFTPELSQHLTTQPNLLADREGEVTVLFCDIRGFSRISERLGPATTMNWLRDVLGVLSDCVLDRQGVLVDYTGDEVLAMWGAPAEQPTHARIACEAALAMMERLQELNTRWQAVLGEPMGLGVGINTGMARVGNTGSLRKFKYGPHGTTVNLASRVQGATKYLKSEILITGATYAGLNGALPARRLCRVRVVNIVEPVTLYELATEQPNWPGLKIAYEKALEEYENRFFRRAASILGTLLMEYPDDGPSLVLLSRAVQAVVEGSPDYDPVWQLPGK